MSHVVVLALEDFSGCGSLYGPPKVVGSETFWSMPHNGTRPGQSLDPLPRYLPLPWYSPIP